MTEQQADQIIKLLISLDQRLERIEKGECTVDVAVQNTVEVCTGVDSPLATYEHRY